MHVNIKKYHLSIDLLWRYQIRDDKNIVAFNYLQDDTLIRYSITLRVTQLIHGNNFHYYLLLH